MGRGRRRSEDIAHILEELLREDGRLDLGGRLGRQTPDGRLSKGARGLAAGRGRS